MAAIPLDHISAREGRYRKDFKEEDIIALAESIHTVGQIHPLRVERIPDSKDASDNWRYWIIAGERRYRALCWLRAQGRKIQKENMSVALPYDTAWCEVVFGHTALLTKEMELDENLRRVDLTWQEVAIATAELHDLRKSINSHWTMRQTMQELQAKGSEGINQTTVRNRIFLAENLNRPELKGITNEQAAFRAVQKAMEKEFTVELFKRGKSRQLEHDIRCIDALEGMRSLPEGTVNCICTDPPYGINAQDFNYHTQGTSTVHIYDDSPEAVDKLMEGFFPEAFRVCKAEAHLYIFCDIRRAPRLEGLAKSVGWHAWSWPLIWVKNQGSAPRPDFGPRHHYEAILFFNKGEKHVYDVYSDVLTYPIDTQKFHAAQKPVEVYLDLLKRSVIPGNIVLDPFCGSAPIVTAGRKLQCKVIAFDLDESNVARAGLLAEAAI